MMLEQINRRLRALQEAKKKGGPTGPDIPPGRMGTASTTRHLPRHALRPPPRPEMYPGGTMMPPRVQTPVVIDGKQVGIIHGEKPMDAKSRKAVTEVVRTALKSLKDGTLKTVTAPPKEKKMPKPKKEPTTSVRHDNVPGAKTIGVKIAPELYARLEQIKERHKLKTIKDALVLAAERGVYKIHEDDTAALP